MMVRSYFAMIVFTGIGALIGFATLSEVQVTAQQQQQQTMPPEQQHNHPNISSNQSSVNSATQQGQKNMTMAMTTEGGEMMMMTTTNDQTFTASSISLVNGVKVVSISPINNDHIAVNLRYETSDRQPPGVSVVALTNSSLDTIMNGMMQNSTLASAANSTLPLLSIQSGSNYLEAGWQPQHPNSATVLVQLNGEIPDGDHVMVLVVPFLHH